MRRVLAVFALLLLLPPAMAQTIAPVLPSAPAEPNQPVPPTAPPAASEAEKGLWTRSNLLGDMGGLRTLLDAHGISFGLAESSELWGTVAGGVKRGAVYDGVTLASVTVDMAKAVGLPGGTFYVDALQIHGRSPTADTVLSLGEISSIEARRATRLFQLWYQQVLPGGALDIRLGQLALDQEFLLSQFGELFLNASFGWPTLAAVDLPGGGPADPLATLGVRLRAHPTAAITLQLAVANGSPAGLGPGDPQTRNRSGTRFRIDSGALVIGEAAFAATFGTGDHPLAGVYKVGFWYDSNVLPDEYVETSGLGATSGTRYRRDWDLYAVVDQQISGPLGVFARAMGSPSDRNVIDVSVDGGVTYKGPFGREEDTVGLGFGWAHISSGARRGLRAASLAADSTGPTQASEAFVELTYQAQLAPWWIVQPDLQYVIRPGGGIANPNQPTERVGNALVLGARTIITF